MTARDSFRRPLFFAVAALAAASLLAGCAGGSKGKKKFAYVERPVERLYADAARQLERKRYVEAVAGFEEVERQHPYSAWARRAILMKAFAQYQDNEYEDAVETLDGFISLHPGNKDAPYAYYLKAVCFYEQISGVGRDQKNTDQAVAALNDVLKRYPNTEYARDARLKLDLTYDHLAAKEMYVGRYYQRNNKTLAAINRYKVVIDKYQTTSQAPEALHRLVENYLTLGLVGEAQRTAAVLGYNYPGSDWYQHSYRLLKSRDLLEPLQSPPGKLQGTPQPNAAAAPAAGSADTDETAASVVNYRPVEPQALTPGSALPPPDANAQTPVAAAPKKPARKPARKPVQEEEEEPKS